MHDDGRLTANPLFFIMRCVSERRVFWTYHVNMRLGSRDITRQMIMESVGSYEIIESYPDDKYLPSYLVYTKYKGRVLHIVFAVDVMDENVRIVTAYYPDPEEWTNDWKQRRTP